MRVLSIKLDWNGGISEYKVTSDKGCAYKDLMRGITKLGFQEYIELYDKRLQTQLEVLTKCGRLNDRPCHSWDYEYCQSCQNKQALESMEGEEMSKLIELLRDDSDIGQYTNDILEAYDFDMGELRAQLKKTKKKNEILMEAVEGISKNTCCDKCQEARLVSLKALEKIKELEKDKI